MKEAQHEGGVVTRTLILIMPTQRRRKKKDRSSLLILPQSSARSIQSLTILQTCASVSRKTNFKSATMLKTILLQFDVAFNSKDRIKALMQKLSYFVQEYNCFLSDD